MGTVCVIASVTLIFCNSSRTKINSLSWGVRPSLPGVLFSKESEEFCISAELVLNHDGVISVLDELFLLSFMKSKEISLMFRLPKEVDLPSGTTSA